LPKAKAVDYASISTTFTCRPCDTFFSSSFFFLPPDPLFFIFRSSLSICSPPPPHYYSCALPSMLSFFLRCPNSIPSWSFVHVVFNSRLDREIEVPGGGLRIRFEEYMCDVPHRDYDLSPNQPRPGGDAGCARTCSRVPDTLTRTSAAERTRVCSSDRNCFTCRTRKDLYTRNQVCMCSCRHIGKFMYMCMQNGLVH